MSSNKPKIVVFISGKGSNLKRLIAQQKEYEIQSVFSNRRRALGLEFAKEAGIPFYIFDKRDYPSEQQQLEALFERLKILAPDLICLAGFSQIIPPQIIQEFWGRIINLHPSLLPRLKGYFGAATHQAALDQNEKEHGCTVHFVDQGVDTGPIIAQAKFAISADMSANDLQINVHDLEHQLLPWVVNNLCGKRITLAGAAVQFDAITRQSAASHNFLLPLE